MSSLIGLGSPATQPSNGFAPVTLFFTVENGPKQVLIRAVGPTLGDFGVAGFLTDPQISLINLGTQAVVAGNAGWQASPDLTAAANAVNAFQLDPKDADAALLATVPTGTWEVSIKSQSGRTGEVLAEIYETNQSGRLVYSGVLVQPTTVVDSISLNSQNFPTVLLRGISSGLALPGIPANTNPITLQVFDQSGALLSTNPGPAANFAIQSSTAGDFPVTGPSPDQAAVFTAASNLTSHVFETGNFAGLAELSLIDSQRTPSAPVVLIPPLVMGQYLPGANLTLSVAALALPVPNYQWQKNGVNIPGATDRIYQLSNLQVADSGSYQVKITNSVSSVLSPVATVAVVTTPVILAQPAAAQAVAGASPTLSVSVSNPTVDSFQWYLNGSAVPGATGQSLTLSPFSAAQVGKYTVTISNAAGTVTSQAVNVSIIDYSRIANLSILGPVSAAAPLTVGYSVTGTPSAGALPTLLRASGPTLALFSIPNFLPDPNLAIYSGTTVVGTNDNWGSDQQNIQNADQLVLAFNFIHPDSADSALLQSFTPGPYSMVVKGAAASSGLVLAEIYDATPPANLATTAPRLINVSSLVQISPGAPLTAGFVILGTARKTVLIRGVGPSLQLLGVPAPVSSLNLTVFDHQSTVIATNAQWGGSTLLANTFASVNAFPLPANSADAAVVMTLDPGAYTASVASSGTAAGTALMEIYEVP